MAANCLLTFQRAFFRQVAGLGAAAGLLLSATPAKSVLFYSTDNPEFNTTAPTKALTNSGWQYQGAWAGFSGTVISSNCFITTWHIGGAVGDAFVFQGVGYVTVAEFKDPDSDLRILRVAGIFPTNAPLYLKKNERGKALVVFGRGTQRGAEVRVNNKLRGWQWGIGDGVQRWGQNRVKAIVDGGTGVGELLRSVFVAGGGRNQADLSGGDSGGAVYIKDGRIYKLAGINYAVDGPYNTTDSGTGFEAAVFDEHGLYLMESADSWTLVPRRQPGGFYATRISSRIDWINSVLGTP